MNKATTGRKTQSASKLYRSEKDRVIAGVCAGLGEFFQVDSTIIRLIFILITVFGGGGILLYLVLWLIIPTQGSSPDITKENIENSVNEMKDKAQEFTKNIRVNSTGLGSRQIVGVAIAFLGLLMLFDTLGFINFYRILKFLPAAIIILVGLSILSKKH